MSRVRILVLSLVALAAAVPPAAAEFPYRAQGGPNQYDRYFLPPSAPRPSDLTGKLTWMYASTAEAGSPFALDPRELNGVRGARLVDASTSAGQAWSTTTGRPDVAIGVTDSGIEWNNAGAMTDLRKKTRLWTGEAPAPKVDRATAIEPGQDCAAFTGTGHDRNDDGVFNVVDYACDAKVALNSPNGVGPADTLEPQDVLIAYSDGVDDDDNGYVDDIVGWDFLDDDNDPYDDVQYGHGTGEARDSNAEPENGGELGSCPNCMVVHLRVGTSFVADVNRFAEAVVYSTDNDILVVQDALGTLNKSKFALDAVKYAYDHGTTIIASAADEAAQHHNQPSSLPYSIVVNSVTHFDDADQIPGAPSPVSYLQFNGCTNFSSRITLAIPSVSCSSDATGRGAGMAGLLYAAALNAVGAGRMAPHPSCVRPDGKRCVLSANEVRQLMIGTADDVDFSVGPEPSCPLPGCTDPFFAMPTRIATPPASYPAREGHDQFYGYGRVNMDAAIDRIGEGAAARIPPEVEVESPNWFDMVDPEAAELKVEGTVDNRGGAYTCRVYAAPGSYPGPGDFVALPSGHCDGASRTGAFKGRLASVSMATLKGLFPPGVDFAGSAGPQPYGGRPNTEPHGFVVKAVVTAGALSGEDRRQAYLHRDAEMLDGFPRQLAGDVEASPVLADVDGDNENELVLANSDGGVHVYERDGGEAAGWPRSMPALRPHHFAGHPVDPNAEAVLATPAVGDLDRDGEVEIVVADLDRTVRVFNHDGTLAFERRTNPRYAGIPAEPFVNLRKGTRNRTQPGSIGAPVLGDLDADGTLEIVVASMDRHVYAWHADGSPVDGWPALVVDRTKLSAIDPVSHQVTFSGGGNGDGEQQGAIVSTPAVADITGDGKPEVIVGTNEEYDEPINAGSYNEAEYAPLGEALAPGNGRLHALKPTGLADNLALDNSGYLPGWPFKVGILQRGLLPLVGEGINGAPVVGSLPCNGVTASLRIGIIPAAGLPYLINPDGKSCYGQTNGKDIALPTSGGLAADPIFFGAVGHPALGTLAGQPSLLAPVAGVLRAADVVLPEYQGGRDMLAAWNGSTGQIAPGWPIQVNDLQFLTGPSLADVGGLPGSEVFGGTASDDLYGVSGTGAPIDAGWPKVTGDWTVSHPVIGTWGKPATKVIVGGTRSGRLHAYETGASGCLPADWPQFHHDPFNSGDWHRDAVAPGAPVDAAVTATEVTFKAPGDDLLCGRATRYEAAIDGADFAAVDAAPKAAGEAEALPLAGTRIRVRAVDDQGNVGRAVTVERTTPAPTATATATSTASPVPTASPTATASPGGPTACRDTIRPTVRITVARLRARSLLLRGRVVEPGCARIEGTFVTVRRKGKRILRVRARGGRRWRARVRRSFAPGRYVVRVHTLDRSGNRSRTVRRRLSLS